jgi:hypothetical protein
MSEEVHRLRPPRFIRRDGVVTPFTYYEAEGNEVLQVSVKYQLFVFSPQTIRHLFVP